MPLSKIDSSDYLLHLKYDGADVGDAGRLREELLAEIDAMSRRTPDEIASGGDFVIEFAEGAMIYSSEIGIIAQFLKAVTNTGANSVLRIVASDTVLNILQMMNMHKLPGIKLHKSLSEISR